MKIILTNIFVSILTVTFTGILISPFSYFEDRFFQDGFFIYMMRGIALYIIFLSGPLFLFLSFHYIVLIALKRRYEVFYKLFPQLMICLLLVIPIVIAVALYEFYNNSDLRQSMKDFKDYLAFMPFPFVAVVVNYYLYSRKELDK
jgi:hypothetical protein